MAKKTPDIIYNAETSFEKRGRSKREQGGFFNESGLFCSVDGGCDEDTFDPNDLLDQELREAGERERMAGDYKYLDAVIGFDPIQRTWIDGIIIDITSEYGQIFYCIEPMDDTSEFITTTIRPLGGNLDVIPNAAKLPHAEGEIPGSSQSIFDFEGTDHDAIS